MKNNHLMTGDSGVNGIFRCKLITSANESDIRVFIPGISSINPFNKNGSVNLETYSIHKNTFPVVQWCCYNVESKMLINQDPVCWCMFENGDFTRPVVISYAVVAILEYSGDGTSSSTYNGSNFDSKIEINPPPDDSDTDWKLLGNDFVITHYCIENYPHICNDGDASTTATGTKPTPGRTIAVDPTLIPYGTRVKIYGHVYIAEDCGGAIKGHRIDIVVDTHSNALAKGKLTGVSVYIPNI